MGYQMKMQSQGKSGLGHIKRLRSGLSKAFLDKGIALSALALKNCELWTRSRKNDDMAAKTKSINPVKYSNAQKSLPWPAYKKIAKILAIKSSPFFLVSLCVTVEYDCASIERMHNQIQFNELG